MHLRTITFCSWAAGLSWLVLAAAFATGVSDDRARLFFCLAALFSGTMLWLRIRVSPQTNADAERRAKLRGVIVVTNAVAITGWSGLAIWAYAGEATATSRCLTALTALVSVVAMWMRISRSTDAHHAGYDEGFEAGFARGRQLHASGQPARLLRLDDATRERLRAGRLRVVHTTEVRSRHDAGA